MKIRYRGWIIRELRPEEKTYFQDGSHYDYVAIKGDQRIEGLNPDSLKRLIDAECELESQVLAFVLFIVAIILFIL